MSAPTTTTAPTVTCTPWCLQGDGHPGERPGTAVCISDLPDDELLTPTGEAAHYLTCAADGVLTVRIEVGRADGTVTAITASVAEARAWFTAGLAACDLATLAREAAA